MKLAHRIDLLDPGITMEDDFRTILTYNRINEVTNEYLNKKKIELYAAYSNGLRPYQVYDWMEEHLIKAARKEFQKPAKRKRKPAKKKEQIRAVETLITPELEKYLTHNPGGKSKTYLSKSSTNKNVYHYERNYERENFLSYCKRLKKKGVFKTEVEALELYLKKKRKKDGK